MGSKGSKATVNDIIGHERSCPTCDKVFPPHTKVKALNEHIINCAHNTYSKTEVSEDYNYNSNNDNDDDIFNYFTYNSSSNSSRNKTFESKVKEIRSYINNHKISWEYGCDTLKINRENALRESMDKIDTVNLLKEVKIDFMGEVSYDAGGILREWFMVLIQELESKEMNLFQRSDCDEICYVPHNTLRPTEDVLNYFEFLGKLIAKALIDNITINLCFNKILFKMLIDEQVTIEDVKNIDSQLYASFKNLQCLSKDEIAFCEIYYVYEYQDENGKIITEELIDNGSEVLVKDVNDYIQKRISFLVKKYKPYVDSMKKQIDKYIPLSKLRMFNSYEFELVVCGKPFIDVSEWSMNTTFQGKYSKKHKVVNWFWESLSAHTQEELSKFLQFCTGSSRVPIGGFSMLESNRGEIKKFCLNSVEYNKKGANFIKAHTCFNRVDLPMYKHKKEVEEAINTVLNNEIIGFGID